MTDLSERQVRVLRVLAEHRGNPLNPGYIWRLAFGDEQEYRGRRDAGMTRTLDALRRHGLVEGDYPSWEFPGREWQITQAGIEALDGD